MSFMNIPPVLHIIAHMTIISMAFLFLCIMFMSYFLSAEII